MKKRTVTVDTPRIKFTDLSWPLRIILLVATVAGLAVLTIVLINIIDILAHPHIY